MPIKFKIHGNSVPVNGKPKYVVDDQALAYLADTRSGAHLPSQRVGQTSLVAGTLQLEVSVPDGTVMWLWGYAPLSAWRRASLIVPEAKHAALTVVNPNIEAAKSVRLWPDDRISLMVDPSSGWFRLCDATYSPREQGEMWIEFAQDTIAELRADRLVAIFVRPENWKRLRL